MLPRETESGEVGARSESRSARAARYRELEKFVRAAEKRREQGPEYQRPSPYWRDFVGHFRYVFGLPADELERIRLHTYHLTSDLYQRYYFADSAYRSLLQRGHLHFTERLSGFAHYEDPATGIGVETGPGRVSHDLLRYLGVLTDLVESAALRRDSELRVLELGGGYGGLALAVLCFAPGIRYTICDLEETLFFSGCHLVNELGASNVHLRPEGQGLGTQPPGHVELLAQTDSGALDGQRFDLVINQQSLQEMTEEQVARYLEMIAAQADSFFSCNLRDHGELADRKGIVRDLDARIEARLGAPIWRSRPPAPELRFGDNDLERRLHRSAGRAASR